MTWELYLYSLGMRTELLEYWEEREREKEVKRKKGIKIEESFRRIDEIEKSVEIFDNGKKHSKNNSSVGGSKVQMRFDDNLLDQEDIQIQVNDVDLPIDGYQKPFNEVKYAYNAYNPQQPNYLNPYD